MRILAINGSHRGRRGFTQVLLDHMKAGAEEGGAEFETIVLAEKTINRCSGCETCHTERSYLRCVFEDKDEVQAIFREMRSADILVFATPVYVFAMSSLLKGFLDRINSTGDVDKLRVSNHGLVFHHIDAQLCSKPFVLVATCGNIEKETPKNVVDYFKTYSRFMDAPMLAALVRSGSSLLGKSSDEELPKRADVLSAYREAGRDLALGGGISPRHIRQANRNIVPMSAPIKLLMHIKPLRPALIAEGIKRGALRFK